MKKLYVIMMMVLMTIPVFAETTNDAIQQVMKVLENKQWVIVPTSADIANGIHYDGIQEGRSYFCMDGDNMKVKIDFTGARESSNIGFHKAETLFDEIVANGNNPLNMPAFYTANYKILKQDISTDKKGRNIIVRFSYLIENSNIFHQGSTPMMEVRIRVKDMSATVHMESIRIGESYNGTLMAVAK